MAWGRVASREVKFESVKTAPPNGLDGFGNPKAERLPPPLPGVAPVMFGVPTEVSERNSIIV